MAVSRPAKLGLKTVASNVVVGDTVSWARIPFVKNCPVRQFVFTDNLPLFLRAFEDADIEHPRNEYFVRLYQHTVSTTRSAHERARIDSPQPQLRRAAFVVTQIRRSLAGTPRPCQEVDHQIGAEFHKGVKLHLEGGGVEGGGVFGHVPCHSVRAARLHGVCRPVARQRPHVDFHIVVAIKSCETEIDALRIAIVIRLVAFNGIRDIDQPIPRPPRLHGDILHLHIRHGDRRQHQDHQPRDATRHD